MPERITEVWGARTPYGAEQKWPERVDSYLTVPESQVQRWVQSACVFCSNGCGMDVAVVEDKIVGVRGRANDRVNHGRLGPKGLYGWQANASEDRLTKPLIRRDGELVECDWDTAMSQVVERSQQVIEEHTRLGMGFYTSGRLFAEEHYALALLARGGIGTPHLDGNTRLCTATSEWALVESFGSDGDPGSYTDFDACDTLFLVGHNPADLSEPRSDRLANVMAGLRHKSSELLGRRPESGLLLLRDLRQLFLMAQEANVHWLALGQVAQAVRDHDLLDQVSDLHKQTLTQIKWLKTRMKESTLQVLVAGS